MAFAYVRFEGKVWESSPPHVRSNGDVAVTLTRPGETRVLLEGDVGFPVVDAAEAEWNEEFSLPSPIPSPVPAPTVCSLCGMGPYKTGGALKRHVTMQHRGVSDG